MFPSARISFHLADYRTDTGHSPDRRRQSGPADAPYSWSKDPSMRYLRPSASAVPSLLWTLWCPAEKSSHIRNLRSHRAWPRCWPIVPPHPERCGTPDAAPSQAPLVFPWCRRDYRNSLQTFCPLQPHSCPQRIWPIHPMCGSAQRPSSKKAPLWKYQRCSFPDLHSIRRGLRW